MDKYELFESQIHLIESFLEDYCNNNKNNMSNYSGQFYYRFFDGQYVKGEVMDIVPNDNLTQIHDTLKAISICNNSFSGNVINNECYPIAKKTAITNLTYLKDLLQHEIQKHYQEIKEVHLNLFSDELFKSCRIMQANHLYRKAKENNRNDFIRDLLTFKGYYTKDQTRHGPSLTGKDSGQVDILVCKNKLDKEIIVEGMNLKSCDEKYIEKHVNQVFEYDTSGNEYNFLVVYVNINDFKKFVLSYKELLDRKKMHDCIDNVIEQRPELSDNIRVIKSSHLRNGAITVLYHVITYFGR